MDFGIYSIQFENAKKVLDGVIVVSLEEIAFAIKLVAERNKTILEGAGAAPVAAAVRDIILK